MYVRTECVCKSMCESMRKRVNTCESVYVSVCVRERETVCVHSTPIGIVDISKFFKEERALLGLLSSLDIVLSLMVDTKMLF